MPGCDDTPGSGVTRIDVPRRFGLPRLRAGQRLARRVWFCRHAAGAPFDLVAPEIRAPA